MQNEGPSARKCGVTFGAGGRLVVRWLGGGEIWNIQSCPLLLCFVPPDEFFAFAPGPSIGRRRGAVIKDAAICRPGKSPTVSVEVTRLATVGAILIGSRKHAEINPTSAGGGPIG